MRLLLVYQDSRLASSRIRIQQMAPHLEALGARTEVVQYPGSLADKRALLQRAARADVTILQRKLFPYFDSFLWRMMPRPVVFDFDDAIMFRDHLVRGSYVSRTRRRRFRRIVGLCGAFICGNDYLASFVAGTGKPVLVAASPVPIDVPRRARNRGAGPPRIGWIGSRGNLDALASVRGPLERLARKHDFVLTVIADAAPRLDGCRIEHIPWRLDSQAAELARLDVGIMPLVDSPWTRGKCAYKLLQYMAAAVPSVASAVGMNASLIVHEENGLLATTDDEWVTALGRLLADTELRAELGAAGRRTVENGYSYQIVSRRWMEFLEQVVSASRS